MARLFVLFAMLLGLVQPSHAASPADLHALFADWRRFHAARPANGVPDYTPAAITARAAGLQQFEARLAAIDTNGWDVADKVDWQLVRLHY